MDKAVYFAVECPKQNGALVTIGVCHKCYDAGDIRHNKSASNEPYLLECNYEDATPKEAHQ
jgi:hypothetical protein